MPLGKGGLGFGLQVELWWVVRPMVVGNLA